MLFRNLIVSAFVAVAAASNLAARGEEHSATSARPTITSTTKVYITVHPTATGTGVPVPSKNGTSPVTSTPPLQNVPGAGASNSVPMIVLGGAAAIAYALI